MKLKKFYYVMAAVIAAAVAAFVVLQPSSNEAPAIQAEVQDIITCQDSDGMDISTKGTAVQTVNGAESMFTDECSGNILKEFICNGNRIASRLQKCNCDDGKCV